MISVKADTIAERTILLRLDELTPKLKSNLRPAITRLTEQLLQRIRAAEPVRTGKLRQATQSFIDESENRISGKVRILGIPGRGSPSSRGGLHNVAAAALEYGAHRSFTVKAHQQRLSHVFGRKTDARFVMVAAYTRKANIQAERFLRDPAAAMRPQVITELERIVRETLT